MLNADEKTAKSILLDLERAAVKRLNEELKQSEIAINKGDAIATQLQIISAWKDWYQKSFATTLGIVSDEKLMNKEIAKSQKLIDSISSIITQKLQDEK